jgi:hypothetical protein
MKEMPRNIWMQVVIILKLISKRQDRREWIGFICLRI